CGLIILVTRRRRSAVDPAGSELDAGAEAPAVGPQRLGFGEFVRRPLVPTLFATATVFAITTFTSRLSYAVLAALAMLVLAVVPRLVPALGLVAAALLMASRLAHRPELAWLALAFFAVAVAIATRSDRKVAPD
ncbi:MAG: hypothetical protein ABJC79_15165, partial [Acidimicrobiia bacterium]